MATDIENFLLELSESKECKDIRYKRLAIRKYMGIYYSQKMKIGQTDAFMIPLGNLVKERLVTTGIDVDELVRYMIDNDESNCALFAVSTWFEPKSGISRETYMGGVVMNKILTPYVAKVDLDALALIVENYILDNLCPRKIDIREFVKGEIFKYPTNQYGLTRVNGAVFKRDGLLFDGKGYYYNILTDKTLINEYDSMPGFAQIITDYVKEGDILYRLDERLSMPEEEYNDYTGIVHAKYYGPQFNFRNNDFVDTKTIIVHGDNETFDKLLMVIKKDFDQSRGESFLHIEIEALPYREVEPGYVITTFLHGMYYPKKDFFTHIDYTKNQYDGREYLQKYQDSNNGVPIDQYTAKKELHYKIWCIENGEFSREIWYKLMISSLPKRYRKLLDEILT